MLITSVQYTAAMIKAFILDLDNTIYPVRSIGYDLFSHMLELFDEYKDQLSELDMERAKNDLMAKPFQLVADKNHFPKELKDRGIELLRNLTYDKPMKTFDEYEFVRSLPFEKFLVTTGFEKLQWSKVKMLGIGNDFKKIYIVDPDKSELTKKDIFEQIMVEFNYQHSELLVIGDDPESEIRHAKTVGIKTFLYDPENNHPDAEADVKARSFKELTALL